jgi:hypothetical protein
MVKVYSMVAIGFTFALSLRRYFPDTVITNNKIVYSAVSLGVMMPMYAMAKISTNKEVID